MGLFQSARILIEHSVATDSRLNAIAFKPYGTHRGALSGRDGSFGKIGDEATERDEFGEAGNHSESHLLSKPLIEPFGISELFNPGNSAFIVLIHQLCECFNGCNLCHSTYYHLLGYILTGAYIY